MFGGFYTRGLKPRANVKPNRGHPQMRGCIHFWSFQGGAYGVVHDVIGGNHATIGTPSEKGWQYTYDASGTPYFDAFGRSQGPWFNRTGTGAGRTLVMDRAVVRGDGEPFTWVFHCFLDNISQRWYMANTSGNASTSVFRMASNNARSYVYDDASTVDTVGDHPARAVHDIETHALVLPADNNPIWYMNAEEPSSSEAGGTIDVLTFDMIGNIGHVDYAWVRAYNRALTHAEIYEIYRDPFACFRRPLPIWINTVGATTHEASSTYALQKNISNTGIGSYQASATYSINKDIVSVGAGSLAANCIFALQHALSNDSAISIEAATSYALQNGLTLSAIMQRESAITLAVQKALQSSATTILNGNVSVDLSNALNVLGGLLLDGDASYALQSDLSNTADITLENSISLALQNALSNVADALLVANVNIGLEKTLTLNSIASLVSAVTLTHSLGYTSQRSSIYDTALTLAINAGITNAGELTGDLEAAVTYALQCSQSQSGAAVFAATSTLDLQNALLTVAAKILEGGITLSSTYLHSDTASRDIAGLITLGLTNNQITTALISLDCSVEYALNIFQQATAQATLQTNTTIDVQFELTSRGIDFDFGISDGGPTFTVQADITYEPTASTTKDVKIIH